MIFRKDTVMYHPIEGARTFYAGEEDHGPLWRAEPWAAAPVVTFTDEAGIAQPVRPPVDPLGMHETTPIPENWRELKWFALRSLAARLTNEPVNDKADAIAAIEAELARRG